MFYNDLINKGLKPSSVKKVMETLKGCFKYAQKLNLINALPTDIETIPQPIDKIVVWDEAQLKYFLSEIKDSFYYMHFLIISQTGLRVGELCGLRWENIDFKKGIIYVREQAIYDKSNKKLMHTTKLKTEKSYRDVSIPDFLVAKLKSYKFKQSVFNSKGFVVLDKNNKMCNPRNVSMNFKRCVEKYQLPLDTKLKESKNKNINYQQLPQITIHGLRHTHATILMINNEHIKVISDRLGHNSVKFTLDVYSHILPSMHKQTAHLLDDVFGGL